MCRLISCSNLRRAKLSGCFPGKPTWIEFQPAALFNDPSPWPTLRVCDPERPSFHIPARFRVPPALKEPPICRTSAAGLNLLIRDTLLGRPATDTARSHLSLGPASLSGDPWQGQDPMLRTPREKVKPIIFTCVGGSGWRRM